MRYMRVFLGDSYAEIFLHRLHHPRPLRNTPRLVRIGTESNQSRKIARFTNDPKPTNVDIGRLQRVLRGEPVLLPH